MSQPNSLPQALNAPEPGSSQVQHQRVSKSPTPPRTSQSPPGDALRSGPSSAVASSPTAIAEEPSNEPIEVGNGLELTEEDFAVDSDADTGYGDDDTSSLNASITSSIRDHTFENGLRYHSFRRDRTYYPFPNDENEQNRDDMKHAMTVLMCGGKLHFAPIGDNPQEILDLGTGSGIWAIERDMYPSARVQGIDLSPIQPLFVPPNVKFIIDDIEDEWLYPLDSFDYIHCRHVTQTIKNRPLLMTRALRHLKPGGYLEFQEMVYYPHCDDGSMTDPYPFREFVDNLNRGMAILGGDNLNANNLAAQMRDAGFEDVQDVVLRLPVGVWPKDRNLKLAGLYLREAMVDGLKNIASRVYTAGLGWSLEALEVYLVDVRKSLYDSSKHSYFPLHIIVGRKPLEP